MDQVKRDITVVFLGTPDFACPALTALNNAYNVKLVITRPDSVQGRGSHAEPSPVAKLSESFGIAFIRTNKITPEVLKQVQDIHPDIIAVAAFGALLPDDLIKAAKLACINIHGSLLPKWRGAAPFQRAILAGDDEIGVSIMQVVHELDAGDYAFQASIPVEDKTLADLSKDLAKLGAEQLLRAIDAIADHTITWQTQDETCVTYAQKVAKEEFLLSPSDSASQNQRRVQASSDGYPARFILKTKDGSYEKVLRVLKARAASHRIISQGGVERTKHELYLGTSDGALQLLRVKPLGKAAMDVQAFVQGIPKQDLEWKSCI